MEEKTKKIDKKNKNISYIKGIAFLFILTIHLFEWGNASQSGFYTIFRKIFYPGLSIFLFVSMSGALIYLAYRDYSLKKASKRLISRGFKLILIYYFYNIIKLFLFDFSKEPLYSSFIGSNRIKDLLNILTLQKSTAPISILFTIGIFLIISPLFLYIIRKFKKPKLTIFSIMLCFVVISMFIGVQSNYAFNLLYSSKFATFPFFLWIIPYMLGIFIASIGFEKRKKMIFFMSVLSVLFFIIFLSLTGNSIDPGIYAYQLQTGSVSLFIYFLFFSLFLLSVFIYIFSYLKKSEDTLIKKTLYILEFVGDRTFNLYLIQWVVIDITYLIFPNNTVFIFLTTPIFLILYCVKDYKKAKLLKNKTFC